jgi:sugar phosphate isomerase/epimerase
MDANLYQNWQDARSMLDYHRQELLPASIEYAQEIGAEKIIVFGFARGAHPPGPAPDEILECLHGAAEQAETAGLQLVIEVENQFWADTGPRTADILRAVRQPALGVNWDPGNAFEAGDNPYPDGYQAVREYIRHVHFKDVIRLSPGVYRYERDGQIDWSGQIQSLAADGYGGFVSVEPHLQPKVASARALTRRLQGLLAAATDGM